MTEPHIVAARRTALAAREQRAALAAGRLSPDIARPELFKLGNRVPRRDRHPEGYQLVVEGLSLIAPADRRKFVEAAMQKVEELDQGARRTP